MHVAKRVHKTNRRHRSSLQMGGNWRYWPSQSKGAVVCSRLWFSPAMPGKRHAQEAMDCLLWLGFLHCCGNNLAFIGLFAAILAPPTLIMLNPYGWSLPSISFGDRSWAINPCFIARWYALQNRQECIRVVCVFSSEKSAPLWHMSTFIVRDPHKEQLQKKRRNCLCVVLLLSIVNKSGHF